MVTIKDVAKLAGVSTSTASRAMHDSSIISEATKERVRQAMAELDYSPNFSAQNLVNRKTNTIGIVLPVRENQDSLGDNPFFMQIIQGISSVCSQNDYMVSLATGRSDRELEKNTQTLIRSGNIDKIIFLYSKKGDPIFTAVKKQRKVSSVVVGQAYDAPSPNIHYVDNNNYQASQDATKFLWEKGYRHIVYAYTDMQELVQSDRYEGYRAYATQKQLTDYSLYLSRTNDEANVAKLQSFLADHPEVQAFIACDDIQAIRLQRLFKIIDVAPDRYAIFGFNNSLITKIASPALTSVDIFPYELGEKAATVLLGQAENSQNQTLIIPHKIIERESTPSLTVKTN